MKFRLAAALVGAIASLVALGGLPAPAKAQSTVDQVKDIVFSEAEKRILRDVFGKPAEDDDGEKQKKGKDKGEKGEKGAKGKKDGLPPGLAKRSSLPPGLAKRQTLPPGLETRALPADVEQLLPPTPEGLERVIVDQSVVLMEKGTQKVLDILEGVLTGGPSGQ